MIDLDFVERLIRTLDSSSVDHVEIERGGTRILVSKSPTGGAAPAAFAPVAAPAPASPSPPATIPGNPPASESTAPPPPPAGSNLKEITSPMVGTFYRAPAPDAAPFADVGAKIARGDTLCIIEAMKLMNELEAEIEGTIREVCVENAQPVEYGQVLFRVEPV